MSDDKLTEARLSETLGAVFRDAKRWAVFPTDDDVERAEDAGWVHDENGDLTFDVRAALAAVKREDE